MNMNVFLHINGAWVSLWVVPVGSPCRKGNSRVLVWPGLFGCTGKLKERKWEVQSFKFLAQEDQAASKDSKMDLSTPIATGLKPNAAGC